MEVQLLSTEDGHLVLPYEVDVPLNCLYQQDTGELVVDTATLRIAGVEKAGILRLRFSPEAAHAFLQALRAVEEQLAIKIGSSTKRSVQ